MNNQRKKLCCCSIICAALILLFLFRIFRKENYKLFPSDVTIVEQKDGNCKSLFDLPYNLECVPGPSPKASDFTIGLTPGGICGAQKCVNASADYKIESGIGGSLI